MTQETSGPRVESKVQNYLNSVKRTSEDRKDKMYLYNEINKNRFFYIGTLPVGFSRVLIFFAKMTNEFVEIMEVQGIDKSQGYERYC